MKSFRLFLPLSLFLSTAGFASETKKEIDPFDFTPSPAIWQISDEDTTIYLFGTVHLLPKKLKWRTEKFNNIVNEVDSLVVETSDADFENSDSIKTLITAMVQNIDRPPLLERVEPENRSALSEVAEYTEMPMTFLDFMPTWMVSFMVYFKSIEEAEAAGEYGGDFGVETILEAEFAEMQKPIGSIEDSEAIIRALSELPEDDQLVMVNDLLEEWRKEGPDSLLGQSRDSKNKEEDFGLDYSDDIAWAKGRVDELSDDLTAEALGEGFYNILIRDRNIAWIKWLQQRMEKPGKILLAVGAGHFAGEHAIQKLLTEKNIKVERLQ